MRLPSSASQLFLSKRAAPAPSLTGTHVLVTSTQRGEVRALEGRTAQGQSFSGAPCFKTRLSSLPFPLQTQVFPPLQEAHFFFTDALVTLRFLPTATRRPPVSSTTLMKSLTALRLTGKGQPPLYCRRDLHRDQHPTERMRPVPQNLPVPLCPAQEEKGALVPRTIQCIVAHHNNIRRSPGACCPRGRTDPPRATPTRARYVFDTETDADLHVLTPGKFRQNSDCGPFAYRLHA